MRARSRRRIKRALGRVLGEDRSRALAARYRALRAPTQPGPTDHQATALRVRRELVAGAPVPADVLLVTHPVYGAQFVRRRTTDFPTFEQVFGRGDYDLDYGIEPRHILDLGANVGYSAVFYHHRFPDARIIAVEPDAGNCAMAALNLAAVGATDRCTLVERAIWHSDTHVRIVNPKANAWAFRVNECPPDARGAMEGVTVGTLMSRFELPVVDLVKVDIEAGERFLFAAHTEWLERVNVMVIELHDRFTEGCREPVIAALERHFGDFTEKTYGENTVFARRRFLPA